MKIKLNDLKKAGKELNDLLFDPDKKDEGWIDVKVAEDELKQLIFDASKLLEEDDQLSETTEEVVEAVKEELAENKKPARTSKSKDKEPETNKDENSDDILEEMVEAIKDADLDDLKEIVKDNDEFKDLRKSIGIQRNADKLRAKMFDALGVEVNEDEGEKEETNKKSDSKSSKSAGKTKEKSGKKETKKSTPAYNRVDAVCEALKENKPESVEEWVSGANTFMEDNGKNPNDDENKFIIRYIQKMAKHFDFGVEVPTE